MKHTVVTREDFIKLLLLLSADFKKNTIGWENRDISSFLESMASWIEDMDGFYLNQNLPLPTNISWSNFADMMLAAKVYE